MFIIFHNGNYVLLFGHLVQKRDIRIKWQNIVDHYCEMGHLGAGHAQFKIMKGAGRVQSLTMGYLGAGHAQFKIMNEVGPGSVQQKVNFRWNKISHNIYKKIR